MARRCRISIACAYGRPTRGVQQPRCFIQKIRPILGRIKSESHVVLRTSPSIVGSAAPGDLVVAGLLAELGQSAEAIHDRKIVRMDRDAESMLRMITHTTLPTRGNPNSVTRVKARHDAAAGPPGPRSSSVSRGAGGAGTAGFLITNRVPSNLSTLPSNANRRSSKV